MFGPAVCLQGHLRCKGLGASGACVGQGATRACRSARLYTSVSDGLNEEQLVDETLPCASALHERLPRARLIQEIREVCWQGAVLPQPMAIFLGLEDPR